LGKFGYLGILDLSCRKEYLICALLFSVYVLILPNSGHDFDTFCWREWSIFILENGLGKVYDSWTNYLPLYHYVLFLFGKIQGSAEDITRNSHYLKAINLMFDFSGALIAGRLAVKESKGGSSLFYSLLLLLNIAYLYNTMIWNQMDSILATLALIMMIFAATGKVTSALIFLVLLVNLKLQSVIFIPLLGLLLIPAIVRQFTWQRLATWIVIPAVVYLLILLPFMLEGGLVKIIGLYASLVDTYPYLSMNAYNFWYWWAGDNDPMKMYDSTVIFAGLTAKNTGLMAFFITSGLALFPLLRDSVRRIIYGVDEVGETSHVIPIKKVMLAATLVSLLFFFFNTQMHERYSHPAILFSAVSCMISGRYIVYVLISCAYLLNMEAVLKFWNLPNYHTLVFHPDFVAGLYFLAIVMLFVELFLKKQKCNAPT